MDHADPRAHRRRRAARTRTSTLLLDLCREHDGQDDLRAQRRRGDAGRQRSSEVPATSSSATSSEQALPVARHAALEASSRCRKLTIDGRAVDGRRRARRSSRRRKQRGRPDPALLLPPGLPVAGVCRMCLVEVEKAPKLAPACATRGRPKGRSCTSTASKVARGARGRARVPAHQPPARLPDLRPGRRVRAAGLRVRGRRRRRAATPRRSARKPKVRGLRRRRRCSTPNRCILCTRCVRFWTRSRRPASWRSSSAASAARSGSSPAGGSTTPYAGNVVDLCPVGALTLKDFRFKARVWDLENTASVCTGCARGCNVVAARPAAGDDDDARADRRPRGAHPPARQRRRQPLLDVRPRPAGLRAR